MIEIRKVQHEDSSLLLKWRNHPEVYRYALNANPVTETEHLTWLSKKLSDAKCLFYICFAQGKACGSIRFDLVSEVEAEVSISLAPEFWGAGIATELLRKGEEQLRTESEVKRIKATVLNENKASLRLFEKAQFKPYMTLFMKEI